MYKDVNMQTLFVENSVNRGESDTKLLKNEPRKSELEFQDVKKDEQKSESSIPNKNRASAVEKIVWFFDDKSFEEYFPNRWCL